MSGFQTVVQTGVGARPEAVWLALGTVVMLLGTVYFLARGWNVEDPRRQEFYVITIMITAIASAAYLSMFLGFGLTEVAVAGVGTLDIYWARYADWLFTTPLLLLDLGLLANASRTEISALVLVDAFMIVTGLVGALTEVYAFRFVWWTMSTIAMIVVLYYLFSVLTERARAGTPAVRSTFTTLRNLTIVLWSLYPVLWLVGTEGAGLVGLFVETLGFMVLDVLAKVGFGVVLLRSRAIAGDPAAVEEAAEAAETAGTAAGRRRGTFEVYEDRAGEFRWRLRAGNGRIVADSGEGYASKQGRDRALDRVRDHVADADVFELDSPVIEIHRDRADEWRWRLRHPNGNALADSGQGYSRRRGARRAVDRLREGMDESSFEVYEDEAGEYRWRYRAANGRIMADSGEGYDRRADAEAAADRVRQYVPEADTLAVDPASFEVYEDRAGEYRWRLVHRNGNVVADGAQGYASRSGATDAVARVRAVAADADVEAA